ncbi:MAG: TRAP transporter substrate-binding protein [Betaproteobacteria bacterium]|nr:TRAP transporter substrate-binding protein [Betaproteobacteria bacterium]
MMVQQIAQGRRFSPTQLVLGAFFAAGLVAQTPAIAQTELKFADALPKTFSYYDAMFAFKKAVEDKTKSVKINVFGEGVLGDQKALMEGTKVGSIDISVVAHQVSQQFVPEHGVFGLPFVWLKEADFRKFIEGPIAAELGKKMEAHGLKVLVIADVSPVGVLNSKRAVRTPDDMKGLKLRVMQDPMQVDVVKAMGGIPVPMGTTEVYTAIQQGQIDGNATSAQLIWALKNHEVAKHYSDTKQSQSAAIVMMNLRKWNGMTAEQKAALQEGGKAFLMKNREYYTSNPTTSTGNVTAMMQKAGVTITEPDIEAFRKATAPIITAFKQRVKSPLVDQALKEAGL